MNLEVRYHPGAEQRALAEIFNASLVSLLPLNRLQASLEESGDTWSQLEALGLFSMGLDEQAGGSGLGATEEALIVMQLGKCLIGPSVLAAIGATHAVANGRHALAGAQRIAAAYRHGERTVVIGDADGGKVLVRDGATATLQQDIAKRSAIDEHLWHVRMYEGGQAQAQVAEFDAAGLLRLRLIDAAAAVGIAEAALDMGVAYASERKQFGRVIGSFQAIKHHCANMAIAARNARDQVTFASVAIDDGREDAALQVDCALLVAGNAALRNAGLNIQIHGGMGFSEETFPHLLLKRTQLLIALAGGMDAVSARISDLSAKPPNSQRIS